jgi:hypothetical protein
MDCSQAGICQFLSFPPFGTQSSLERFSGSKKIPNIFPWDFGHGRAFTHLVSVADLKSIMTSSILFDVDCWGQTIDPVFVQSQGHITSFTLRLAHDLPLPSSQVDHFARD